LTDEPQQNWAKGKPPPVTIARNEAGSGRDAILSIVTNPCVVGSRNFEKGSLTAFLMLLKISAGIDKTGIEKSPLSFERKLIA